MLNKLGLITIPLTILIIIINGIIKKINIFETFIEGAKEGIKISIELFPTLLGIFLLINIFLNSGLIEQIAKSDIQIFKIIIPKQILPLALFRPISGSGSIGIIKDIIEKNGPDSIITKLGMTIAGSTETTLYTIMIYTNYAKVKANRKIILIGLVADLIAITLAIIIWNKNL